MYDEKAKAAQRAYYTSAHGKAIRKRYRQTPQHKAAQLRYRARRLVLVSARNQAIKKQIFRHYCQGEPRCMGVGCEVTAIEVLQLDHINGGGNRHRKQTQNHIYRWVLRNQFPAGFQVLCANCNRAKHYGISWIPGSRAV